MQQESILRAPARSVILDNDFCAVLDLILLGNGAHHIAPASAGLRSGIITKGNPKEGFLCFSVNCALHCCWR